MQGVIGLIFVFAANGQLIQKPGLFQFQDMAQCQAARESLQQTVTNDESYAGVIVKMACVPAEAFK